MVFVMKLAMSAATALILLGWSQRHRDGARHRILMRRGVVMALMVPLWLGGWWAALGWPLHPVYWLVELFGQARGARTVILVQQGLAGAALLGLVVQGFTGRMRIPLHFVLARWVLPLWLLVYVSTMFFYY